MDLRLFGVCSSCKHFELKEIAAGVSFSANLGCLDYYGIKYLLKPFQESCFGFEEKEISGNSD